MSNVIGAQLEAESHRRFSHGGLVLPGSAKSWAPRRPCRASRVYSLQREHDAVQLADDGAMCEYRRQVEGEGRNHEKGSETA